MPWYILMLNRQWDSSVVECWACNREALGLNPGQGGLPLWVWAPRIYPSSKPREVSLWGGTWAPAHSRCSTLSRNWCNRWQNKQISNPTVSLVAIVEQYWECKRTPKECWESPAIRSLSDGTSRCYVCGKLGRRLRLPGSDEVSKIDCESEQSKCVLHL